MQKVKNVIGRIIVFSIISAVLDVVFHAALSPAYNYEYPSSYFVKSGLFEPAAGVSLLIIFFLLGIVFINIQENLPGKKLLKGLRFGVSFGVFWLIGVVGMTVFYASPLLHEFLGGLCDCASLIILSILLGQFTANDSSFSNNGSSGRVISSTLIIALFFITGQYLAFVLMEGSSYFDISGLATFIWTGILGLWAGIVYNLLRYGIIKEKSSVKRSFFFGGFIVGIDWILFNLFVLLFVAAPVLDPVILSALNILSIIIGMTVFEILFIRKNFE